MRILIVNGPNLNLLGKREPHLYGNQSFESYLSKLSTQYPQLDIAYLQSNHEGELIDALHQEGFSVKGVILNAGAYTHTSLALADAVAAISSPVIEVHISNLYARESFRQHSYPAKNCIGVITGLGLEGYRLAIEYFLSHPHGNG
jgi:3-dehydroquinate dehydratase-2